MPFVIHHDGEKKPMCSHNLWSSFFERDSNGSEPKSGMHCLLWKAIIRIGKSNPFTNCLHSVSVRVPMCMWYCRGAKDEHLGHFPTFTPNEKKWDCVFSSRRKNDLLWTQRNLLGSFLSPLSCIKTRVENTQRWKSISYWHCSLGLGLLCVALPPSFRYWFWLPVFAMGSLRFPWFLGKVGAHPFKTKALQTVPHVTLQFHIKGMTCSGCEAHIENAFSELEDIASVKADYLKGMAVVGHH